MSWVQTKIQNLKTLVLEWHGFAFHDHKFQEQPPYKNMFLTCWNTTVHLKIVRLRWQIIHHSLKSSLNISGGLPHQYNELTKPVLEIAWVTTVVWHLNAFQRDTLGLDHEEIFLNYFFFKGKTKKHHHNTQIGHRLLFFLVLYKNTFRKRYLWVLLHCTYYQNAEQISSIQTFLSSG